MKRFKGTAIITIMLTILVALSGMVVNMASADPCIPEQGGPGGSGGSCPPDPVCVRSAARTDGNWPDYTIGDTAKLEVEDSCEPNAPVYSWRDRDGMVERDGVEIGTTDANGKLVIELTLPDIDICDTYTNEEYAVGSLTAPRIDATSPYTISGCSN